MKQPLAADRRGGEYSQTQMIPRSNPLLSWARVISEEVGECSQPINDLHPSLYQKNLKSPNSGIRGFHWTGRVWKILIWKVTKAVRQTQWSKKYNICLCTSKVKYKLLKVVFKYSTRVNVLESHFHTVDIFFCSDALECCTNSLVLSAGKL